MSNEPVEKKPNLRVGASLNEHDIKLLIKIRSAMEARLGKPQGITDAIRECIRSQAIKEGIILAIN